MPTEHPDDTRLRDLGSTQLDSAVCAVDEPTHGLSGSNKERLLHTLSLLTHEEETAVVYVTHRQEEIDALGFQHVLQLGASSSRS